MSRDEWPLYNFNEPAHLRTVRAVLDGLKGKGVHRVIFQKVRDQKTGQQIAYIFGVVYVDITPMLEEATGEKYDTIRTHGFLKNRFLKRPVVNVHTGEELGEETPSLADISKEECSRYIEQCILFAAENGWEVRPAAQFHDEPQGVSNS
jgi:hypothetical protein